MNKQLLRNCVVSFAFLMFAVTGAFAQVEMKAIGGIATLYALDPIAHALCFDDGREGGVFYKNEVQNRCSHIDFNVYVKDSLKVGIQGGEEGTIIDLGSPTELQKRYGYPETVGNGLGFASLRVANGKIFILKDTQLNQSIRTPTEQELTESSVLFAGGKSTDTAPVKLGHIYLLRMTERSNKTFERFVKLIVLAYIPGESVTLRWQAM